MVIAVALGVTGCASLPPLEGRIETHALRDTGETRLSKAIAPLAAAHPGKTGIHALANPLDAFAARGLAEIPFRGILPATLTTPGAVASFCEAHARFGKLPLGRSLEAAIHYARDGYPVTARLSRWIGETAAELADYGVPVEVLNAWTIGMALDAVAERAA